MNAKVEKVQVTEDQEELFETRAVCPFCGKENVVIENDYTVADSDICEHYDGGRVGHIEFAELD
mgnify:CR=1 FL=1